MMPQIIEQIATQQGWQIQQAKPVHGGDINESFSLQTDKGRFFLKLNDALHYPGMFAAEAEGLNALRQRYPLKVPVVVASGTADDKQYLLLEWLETTRPDEASWPVFGRALAQMHRATSKAFGWHQPNYLGSILMPNDWQPDWPTFYSESRIMPLVKMLRQQQVFSEKDVQAAEAFCKTLPNRMPAEPPALLHGDLWSGNAATVMMDDFITFAIYDPATYHGHREIDIALTQLFGGFHPDFYEAYNEVYPLQRGWQQRLPLFQLSHLLLHAVLFGGSYVSRCIGIMKKGHDQ